MRVACLLVALGALAVVAPPLVAQEVASVEVIPEHASVVAGSTQQFRAVVKDADGNVIPQAKVNWLATPFPIAGADENGVVTTTRPGQVYVLALAEGAIGMAILDIAERPVAEIAIGAPAGTRTVVGGLLPLELEALTELGDPVPGVTVRWRSLAPEVAEVTAAGLVRGVAPGRATIQADAEGLRIQREISVVSNRVARITVAAPEHSVRTGDVIRLGVGLHDAQGGRVDDVPVVWSVSGAGAQVDAHGRFVAEQPGNYVVKASVGGVSGTAGMRAVRRSDPRRVVAVAHLPLPEGVQAAEIWPIGDVVYLSTIGSAVYVYDISDPTAPTLTDSMVTDARLINDVSTTADGRIGVFTREGSSTRQNGIVFFDASDPLHPRIVREYTEGLTGGTHSAFIYGHHVFVTDDATGSLRIIDFSNPREPRQVARWQVERERMLPDYPVLFLNITPSRYLHDVYVEDGLAYLAYWRDGVVILDVGKGIRGGTIDAPRFVSQLRYSHAELYPPGYIAGTHAIYRHGDHLFVGDESYSGVADLFSHEAFATRGLLHVIDVSDVERPRVVAEYDPVEFGVHNFYAEDGLLYIGAYNGGIRLLDVSGELRGDLREQGRVVGSIHTGSLQGFRPNMAAAWSAIPHNGFIYASDINTGLWVARVSTPAMP